MKSGFLSGKKAIKGSDLGKHAMYSAPQPTVNVDLDELHQRMMRLKGLDGSSDDVPMTTNVVRVAPKPNNNRNLYKHVVESLNIDRDTCRREDRNGEGYVDESAAEPIMNSLSTSYLHVNDDVKDSRISYGESVVEPIMTPNATPCVHAVDVGLDRVATIGSNATISDLDDTNFVNANASYVMNTVQTSGVEFDRGSENQVITMKETRQV